MAEKTIKRRGIAVNIRRMVTEWLHQDDAAKQFNTEATKLKEELKTLLVEHGDPDENGHYWITFDDPVDGRIESIKREKRVSRVLDPLKTEGFLRAKGWYEECTEEITYRQINEDAILAKAFQGEITEEELKLLYDVTETFAFVPQRAKAKRR